MTDLKPGDPAPQFTLQCDDGTEVSAASLKGRPAVLYFYPQDDSGGCVDENLEFSALAPDFAARGATLIGISPDDMDSHRKFRAKYGLVVPLGADPDLTTIEAFGLWQLKKLYGREFMGLIRTSFIIDADGKIARIIRATRIKGHAAKVLAALDEVIA
ncbi:peroxiredoxin [Devosia faecipullorum]|uniref:peroxiredoxin n=1 Tax=Devosia faecipullorum TaxID=2755039 RepID=UPI00187B51EC|nr:peroxiredoxin [Devosia faecipullorum]MBE7731712.1 peroxiredoxin [Devosia faecipullorum]